MESIVTNSKQFSKTLQHKNSNTSPNIINKNKKPDVSLLQIDQAKSFLHNFIYEDYK